MRISDWSSDVCSSDLVVGINQRRSSAAPAGRREATCFSNCGQSPPEITATSVTASNRARVAAIYTDSGSLLSASVPSRGSEEHRLGKECRSTCSYRCAPYHYKRKIEYCTNNNK